MRLFRLSAAIAVSVVGVAVMAAIAVREIGRALEGVVFDRDDEALNPPMLPPPLTAKEIDAFVRDLQLPALTDWQMWFLEAHLKGRDA